MSASPPKDADVEQGDPTPENSEQMNRDDPDAQARGEGPYSEFDVKEQDRWLPIANVARIMKMALPENAKIAKEAKECMQECVSEFISFITSEASEKCQQEKRKTVNGEDILFAMTSLGFENYAEALKIYLTKYRETQSQRGDNNHNRPNSGYGAVGGQGAPQAAGSGANVVVGAGSGAAGAPGYPDPESSGVVLAGQLNDADQEYGAVYPAASAHNGTVEDTY